MVGNISTYNAGSRYIRTVGIRRRPSTAQDRAAFVSKNDLTVTIERGGTGWAVNDMLHDRISISLQYTH
jgi:hypothetical protein